jgi:hypothetical protein
MPTGYKTTAPKNSLQQTVQDSTRGVGQPVDEQLRISYGVISEVDEETSQVRVRFLKEDGTAGEPIGPGFYPLINPLHEIHFQYGLLREGLIVRIYWRGKRTPENSIVEVICDEESPFLTKKPERNEIEIGSFKIFSGGVAL